MCPTPTKRLKHEDSWQHILSDSIISPEQLFKQLDIDPSRLSKTSKASDLFRLQVPSPYLQRIEKGNPDDPLLIQILPTAKELIKTTGFSTDPLQEEQYNPQTGIIHKYHGRVLLLVGSSCAINCRFCFRRHFPYQKNLLNSRVLTQAIEYISKDKSIREVIFSGGDPLVSSDKRLKQIIESISQIPHVDTIRIHSRLPIVIPQRITDDMIHSLTQTRLKPVMVIHCNHHREIDNKVIFNIKRLHEAGITILNQSTLLKDVNDSAKNLIKLSHSLFSMQTLPYYLHQLDPVQGAAHFEVTDEKAIALIQEIAKRLPGYLVPRLVKEIPGHPNKLPLTTCEKKHSSKNELSILTL